MPGFPAFASDPRQPAYFRAYVVTAEGGYDWGMSPAVAVRLAGAVIDAALREDDIVEIVGTVRYLGSAGLVMLDAESGHRVGRSYALSVPHDAAENE